MLGQGSHKSMIKRIAFFILLLSSLVLTACSSNDVRVTDNINIPLTVSLDGEWQFLAQNRGDDTFSWEGIYVPANWYKQGFDISGDARYEKDFFVESSLQGKQITIVFNGIDYYSDVWLNGQKLGNHEGYFQKFSFDATSLIKWGESNTLFLRVDSPLEKPDDFSLRKRLIKGIFSHHDTRPGGAWSKRGQEKNTGGIWNSVELHISDKIFAKQLKVTPQRIDTQNWLLKTELELQGDLPQGSEFHWQLKAKNHQAPTLSGVSQQSNFTITAHQPNLW